MAGTSGHEQTLAHCQTELHTSALPDGRTPNRLARIGRLGEAAAKSIAYNPRKPKRLLVSVFRSPANQAPQLSQDLALQLAITRLRGRRLRMDHDIERRQQWSVAPSAVDLSQSALDPVSNHSSADLARDGNPEPGTAEPVFNHADCRVRSMPSTPTLVTSPVICPPPNTTIRRRILGRGRTLLPAGPSIYADRRERPFRRRRDRTARPLRVRMRALNPCFFFRRRLLGW